MPEGDLVGLKAPAIGHNKPPKTKQGDKHHYLPKFYLKQWAGRDGRLCEFSRPYKELKPRMTFPDGTGYIRGLYTLKTLPPEAANFLEGQFLMRADHRAHEALCSLLQDKVELDAKHQNAWSRFLMTLIHRTPENIARMVEKVRHEMPGSIEEFRPEYEKLAQRVPNAPTLDQLLAGFSPADYDSFLLTTLCRLMDSQLLGTAFNNMIWGVFHLRNCRYPLLTSDRPIIMTNGLQKPGAHIVMPVSPNRVFVAVDTPQTADKLVAEADHSKFGERINDLVARQARKFVYGTDDRQLSFVAKRLGEKRQWSPLE